MDSSSLGFIEDEHYTKEVNGVLAEITTFRGEHCDEVRVREVKSGRVSLYRKGILQRAEVRNDGINGSECTEYKRGKVCFYRHLPPLRNTGDVRCIQNCKNGLQLVVEGKGVIYRGGFDNRESMKREGRGMEFDKESGRVLRCGVWEKDALIRIEKEFESEDVMIEYDITRGCNRSALDCYPVYEGGYVFDEERCECVRDGEGCEIDASTGVAVREGRWERGELVDSVDLVNGWYVNTDNINPFAWGLSKHDECESANGVETTTELLVPSNCRNDPLETRFDVREWKNLNRIAIGDDCFGFVEEVKVIGAEELKSMVIGKRSFTKWKNGFGNNPSRHFCLQDCPSLTELKMGNYSFSDYSRFRVENLPSLEVLEVGDWNNKTWCFYWADLELRSVFASPL